MKEVQSILNEMDILSRDQVAITQEEEELKALLQATQNTVSDPCCPPTVSPTIFPCPSGTPNCSPQVACFDFVVPGGLVFTGGTAAAENCIKGIFVNVNCTNLSPATQCFAQVGNCQIPIFVANLSGCVQVNANIPVTDTSGNNGYLCVSNCVCLNNVQVVCSSPITSADRIKFNLQNAQLRQLVAGGTTCGTNEVWELTADIVATCRL